VTALKVHSAASLTCGEGVAECTFDRYEPVSSVIPTPATVGQ
jgi:hypothetical protein